MGEGEDGGGSPCSGEVKGVRMGKCTEFGKPLVS